MNIKGPLDNLAVGRLARLDTVRLGRMQRSLKPGARGDQADTSTLSQLMSGSVKEMRTLAETRPEVIQAFRGHIDEPVDASLHVTNVIFDRMING